MLLLATPTMGAPPMDDPVLPKLLLLLLPPNPLVLPAAPVVPYPVVPVPEAPEDVLPEASVPDVVELLESEGETEVTLEMGVPTFEAYIPPDAAAPAPSAPAPSALPPAVADSPPAWMGCPKSPRGCTCASPKWMIFQSSLPVMGST